MALIRLKWVHRFRDRHGKLRHYFRRPGYKLVPLPGLPGSSEFMEAYHAALQGDGGRREIGKDRVQAGTIAAAVTGYLQSLEFLKLAPATQRAYRRAMERIRREYGDKPVRMLQTHHIKSIMASKISTPASANNFRNMMHLLMQYSIERNWRRDDPTQGIKKIHYDSDGYHTWSEEEIARFEDAWEIGTTQRLAFDLLLHTGQRSADVRQMRPAQVTENRVTVVCGSVVEVVQQKTRAELDIPISPDLAKSLATVPEGNELLVMTSFGKPFSEKGFGNFIKKAALKAGLPHCSAHGLRKSAATRLAEAGCTEHEIMAITGHKTSREVLRYTRAVRQRLMAQGALRKLEAVRTRLGEDEGE